MQCLYWIPAALTVLALPLAAQQPPAAPAPEPGLYMTFETSMGSITCRLFEKESPITVHKMVGLAIGKISYIDPATKKRVVGKHFFDGLTFHRVIPNFMIQGGDPLGNGMGGPEGPGFPYKNESSPDLTFDQPGRLAMANAGRDTNASQFFITEVPVPLSNRDYTIWGQCGNLDVVKAIARVPRNASDRPLQPVVINHVIVKRVGAVPPDAPEAMPAHHPATHHPAPHHHS
jgi:peptidyl-prolyl cis-trans isomerase A (cyclophilin A)